MRRLYHIIITISLLAMTACSCNKSGGGEGWENYGKIAVTGEATEITGFTAKLSGSFNNAPAAPREVGFEWGYSENALSEVLQSEDIFSGTSGQFSATIVNLAGEKTYYYRAYILVMVDGQGEYHYGKTLTFKTLKENSPGGDNPGGDLPSVKGDQRGWYELPRMDISKQGEYMVSSTNSDEYFAYHLCSGGEKGPNGNTARNYTVCYSGDYHCPVWVAAPRHRMYKGSTKRTDAYGKDPAIPAGIQYNSKSTGGGCNKGHMLGSAERTSSRPTNMQVFHYSNIAPQLSSGFNTGGGGWNLLEDYVDGLVCADTLYEVVGCYFKQFKDGYGYTVSPKKIAFGGRSDVSMPTMFYYALIRTKKGNTGKALSQCTADELMCVAFVRSHTNSLKGQRPSGREMMSISALEKITGITYFANVPQAPKDKFDPTEWGLSISSGRNCGL